jgi:hypothetical protein
MNQAQRLQLLKEKLRAVRGYDLPPIPKPERPKQKSFKPMQRGLYPYGVSLCERRSRWVELPDVKPKGKTLRPMRSNSVSPLTRIAEQYPKRLPRRPVN